MSFGSNIKFLTFRRDAKATSGFFFLIGLGLESEERVRNLMGKRKERRYAAMNSTGRRVKLDLFAEPSGMLLLLYLSNGFLLFCSINSIRLMDLWIRSRFSIKLVYE